WSSDVCSSDLSLNTEQPWIMQMAAFRGASGGSSSATVTTTYTYDVLNRLLSKTYSDGTTPAYFRYDSRPPWLAAVNNSVGRLTAEQSVSSFNSWTWPLVVFDYDSMGRILDRLEESPSGLIYTYDLLGNMTSSTDRSEEH